MTKNEKKLNSMETLNSRFFLDYADEITGLSQFQKKMKNEIY